MVNKKISFGWVVIDLYLKLRVVCVRCFYLKYKILYWLIGMDGMYFNKVKRLRGW